MNELDRQLSELIRNACACDQGSEDRQRHLDRLIRQLMTSGRLWRRFDIPEADFQEILQKSWIYFCGNLCEATTAATPYDPHRASVLTWINAYIKMRVLDYRLAMEWEKHHRVLAKVMNDGKVIDPIELIPSPVAPPPILQEILDWIERESRMLGRIYVRDRPEINCKTLILRRLPPQETSWKQLAQEFEVSENTLQGFYRQQKDVLIY